MTRTFRVLSAWAAMILLVGVSRIPAKTQEHQLRKQGNLATLAAGPNSASQDFGDVAVLVDNGVMVTSRNLFDLNGKTLSFEPSGPLGYTVSQSTAVIDSDFGPELRFGYPGAVFPGDDDSQEVPFTAGFPFFGTNYYSAWVNCDGNITFGGPDHSSD